MALVQVSQGANGGVVTTTLVLTNWYLQPVPAQDNTVSVSFQSPLGTVCSATGVAVANSACPSGMGGTSCMKVSCTGSPPQSSTTGVVRALFTLCPASNLGCGRHYSMEVSGTVTLKKGSPVPVPAPVNPQPPTTGGDPVSPGAAVAPAVPEDPIAAVGDTNGMAPPAALDANAPTSADNNGVNNSSVDGATSNSSGSSPNTINSGITVGGNNNQPVTNSSIFKIGSGDSAVTFIGGGIGVLVVVICAAAFFIYRRRGSRDSGSLDSEGKNLSSLENGSMPRSPHAPRVTPLPAIRQTKDGKFDPTNVVGVAHASKHHFAEAGGGRSNSVASLDRVASVKGSRHSRGFETTRYGSLDRAVSKNSRSSRDSPSLERMDNKKPSLERVGSKKAMRNSPPLFGSPTLSIDRFKSVGAVEPNSRSKKNSVDSTASTDAIVHPGYYDEEGKYHYFTAEQLKQLKSKSKAQKKTSS
ncbi:UNVERIFIED_CONTAM: hypothetical protein HDU68_007757 [Siphonaria sp. JEL0065]|nr:hypothetical protein HDU68_007757 [Siphonaria sp. JEL0065]